MYRYIPFIIMMLVAFSSCKKEKRAVDPNTFFGEVDSTEEVLIPSVNGSDERSIEQLKGQVVIMDVLFSTPAPDSKHIQMLKEVYRKYNGQGLEIYQVCMDSIPDRWSELARQLPWIAVYDDNTLRSRLLQKYKVYNIPSMQLFGRDGVRITKDLDIATLDETVAKALAL